MFTTTTLKSALLVGAFLLAPALSNATEMDTIVRTCQFDSPDQSPDCEALIIYCQTRTGSRTDSVDTENRCHNFMKLKCGKRRIYSGDYTQTVDNDIVRVTAGNPAPLGAPFILHELPKSIPGTVDARLTIGSFNADGICRIFKK